MDLSTLVPGAFTASQQPAGATPTPQQIQSGYGYANTLKARGIEPSPPVHAWTQGVNQMLQALAGNYSGYRADQLQRQAYGAQANAIPGAAPYMPIPLAGANWGGGNIFSGDAFGGTAAAPLLGLSAADYG